MTNKNRILIITNLYPLPWQPNRATFNKQQFTYLSEKCDVFILVPVAWADYFKHRKLFDIENDDIHYCPYFYPPKYGRRYYGWFMFLSLLFSSYKWIKSLKINLILSSWAYPDGVGAHKIAKMIKVPFFLKVHGSDINVHSEYRSRAKQISHAANQSKGILAVSKALKNKMINMGVNEHLISVIYNGVSREIFFYDKTQMNKDADVLLFVGNLKKTKGVLELMDSFINIHEKFPLLTLTYAGDGEMMSLLKQKIEQHHLVNKVKLLGNIDHHLLPELMKNAKMLVLPSYNEGVPNVILESMSCGTPVVATAVGGIPEVVDDGFSGILVAKPTVKDVQAGIEKALNHSWDRLAISKSAEQFDWDVNVAELTRLLRLN